MASPQDSSTSREDELAAALQQIARALELSIMVGLNDREAERCFALAERLTAGTKHEYVRRG